MLSAATFAGATTHVVKSGDNMYRIALNHGITVNQLQAANPGVNAQSLSVGRKLVIPARGQATVARNTAPTPAAKPAAAPRAAVTGTYEVKSGDSLSKIARTQGTTVAALQAANPNLNPNKMAIGQKINLSGSGASSSGTAIAKAPPAAPKPAPSPAPKDLVAHEETAAPAPAPSPAPKDIVAVEESKAPAPAPMPDPTPVIDASTTETVKHQAAEIAPAASAYRLIKTTRELTLAEVAKENGTTTDKLNALNGWSFSPQTLLAVDSELYVPAQPK